MLVFDINVSHGNVATRLSCGGMFHNDFIANLPLSLSVKEFWKLVNIWRSYRQKYSGMFLWLTVYKGQQLIGVGSMITKWKQQQHKHCHVIIITVIIIIITFQQRQQSPTRTNAN